MKKTEMSGLNLLTKWKKNGNMLYRRWPWHVFFWIGYVLFRFWPYFITVKYYPPIFLEYMLLSEILFVAATYFSLWLYRKLFKLKKYSFYFSIGAGSWLLYLSGRTVFQFYYLRNEPTFKGSSFADIFLNNIAFVLACLLFITACKYFKDGFIAQQMSIEGEQQKLKAEVNNLKSQIAPHFLFNTLNNLYGLAVQKSDKLPDLMLRLSDLLRHSLYETQKSLVPITDEINVLKSYIELERVRLEDDLQLKFEDKVPDNTDYQIAPLLLIVFVENAFKHAKFVHSTAVIISVRVNLDGAWFSMTIQNNYNSTNKNEAIGIGLINVKRRLEVLYPNNQHYLNVSKDDEFYTVNLRMQLAGSQ